MKKIMQINLTCGVGSTGRLSEALYNACIEQGFEASFCYSYEKATLPNAFSIETKLQNIRRRALNKFFGRKQKHSNPGTKRLINYIEKEKPDLLHLHNIHLNIVNYPMVFEYIKSKNIPVVYTLHDCWSFTGGCYHFSETGCEEYTCGCKTCMFLKQKDDITLTTEKAYKLKEEGILENPNIRIVCVSKWLAACAQKSFMKNMPVDVIYNGIDTEVFRFTPNNKRHELGISTPYVVLGVANIWENRKGLEDFIQLREMLDEKYTIVLIGLSSKQIKNLPEGIIGIPRTKNVLELVQYYSMADVYVNTSKEETFGLTTVEAMACGTPVVVYNKTALPEIPDRSTGIVVNCVKEIKEAIHTLSSAGKEQNNSACINRVKEQFCITTMTKRYLSIYRSILNEQKNNPKA